ncbi:mechanosensitive ion channel, partial [Aliarcobacter butzleri]|nr:mechanosensitive ion channel [Aliarcobacter butzleri]
SSITGGSITNVNANDTRRVDIIVGISYEDNIKHAKEVLANIINENSKVLKDKAVGINVTELADSSVNITINVWVKSSDFASTKAELLESIKTTFDEVGITIPYPKQEVYQYNKN